LLSDLHRTLRGFRELIPEEIRDTIGQYRQMIRGHVESVQDVCREFRGVARQIGSDCQDLIDIPRREVAQMYQRVENEIREVRDDVEEGLRAMIREPEREIQDLRRQVENDLAELRADFQAQCDEMLGPHICRIRRRSREIEADFHSFVDEMRVPINDVAMRVRYVHRKTRETVEGVISVARYELTRIVRDNQAQLDELQQELEAMASCVESAMRDLDEIGMGLLNEGACRLTDVFDEIANDASEIVARFIREGDELSCRMIGATSVDFIPLVEFSADAIDGKLLATYQSSLEMILTSMISMKRQICDGADLVEIENGAVYVTIEGFQAVIVKTHEIGYELMVQWHERCSNEDVEDLKTMIETTTENLARDSKREITEAMNEAREKIDRGVKLPKEIIDEYSTKVCGSLRRIHAIGNRHLSILRGMIDRCYASRIEQLSHRERTTQCT